MEKTPGNGYLLINIGHQNMNEEKNETKFLRVRNTLGPANKQSFKTAMF